MSVVVASRPDGIGTRLLSILHGRRFAEIMGVPFFAHWPDMIDPNYKNDSLLRADGLSDIFAHGKLFRDKDTQWLTGEFMHGKRTVTFPHHAAFNKFSIEQMREVLNSHDVMIYDAPLPIILEGLNPVAEAKEIRRLWQQLNFKLDVRKALVSIIDQLDMDSCVAVHARRGDILNKLTSDAIETLIRDGITQIFQRYIPYQTIVDDVTKKFPDASSVLVCSEDPSIAKSLQNEFPRKKVISSVGKFPLGSDKAAVLDILLLSRAHDIISPFYSAFSDCASKVSRYARLHRVDLDVWNIVPELIARLDLAPPPDIQARKAIIYMTAYQNMQNQPDHPFRKIMLENAAENAPGIVSRMML